MKRSRRPQHYVCLPATGRARSAPQDPALGLLLGFGALTVLAFAFLASLAVAA